MIDPHKIEAKKESAIEFLKKWRQEPYSELKEKVIKGLIKELRAIKQLMK